ncbi:hypothetical protein [Clostridium saccharobutylicum]|uniref:Uncharacterized protein n=1 Tax=Clostridium saccharobutylicum TaxID=169679 RepID=A0A1S8NJ34_CLOSA|nr:hypothetical protein [Clostridium saccharobutylicum]OOM16495.1 hypothetical protein CLOSAC_07660 [Clostridium saccharobutylicum]
MNCVCPWIYVDYRNNIWNFFKNSNKELCYKIMYGEGKWSKESLIDKEVLGFAIYIEEDETIHIVYSNIKGELKYCTMKNKRWVGMTLYKMDVDEFEIQSLKIQIIRDEMHIFYLLIGKDGSDHGVLMHCIWNGRETKVNTLSDIILVPNINEHYMLNINENNDIDTFFITDEGDEISLNYCSFQNRIWSSVKRLYGIQGEEIDFEVLVDKEEINILNKSREDAIYFLDHVRIDKGGIIQEFRVYESSKELSEPLVFVKDRKLYSCWLEQGEILYSVFDNEKWREAYHFDRGNELTVSRYNCFICSDGGSSIKAMKAYATDEPDLYLFVPSQFVINRKESLKDERIKVTEDLSGEGEEVQRLKLKLSRIKLEKKDLENKIDSLNMQLKKRLKSIHEYEDEFVRLVEQKRKADENYKVFLELQQNIQKKLENTNKQLLEERNVKSSIENELKEYKEKNILIKQQVEMLSTENEKLNKQIELEKENIQKKLEESNTNLLEERNIKASIESELKECKEENSLIKQQIEMMSEENKRLNKELEFERNQSIMERLLKRRSNGI